VLDPFSADFRPVRELIKELPVKPSPAVVCRWHRRGANGRRLQVMRIGPLLYTTRGELRDFLNESQGIKPPSAVEREIDRRLQSEGLHGPVKPRQRQQRPTASQK
jgi:hypothetical protein